MKILVDTDIGGDIDDALALAYLLKQPRCDLLGITTVGGQPEKRAALADAICQAAGRSEVPIHVGASAPLLVPERQPDPHQSQALSDDWRRRAFDRRNTAVEFLRTTIRSNPGEITVFAIGPLTNIGLLFALDPDIPALLQGLMIVGGCFSTDPNEEWNITCDPHAAARVFADPIEITSVGWNVTRYCRLDAADYRSRFSGLGGPMAFVEAMAAVFFRYEQPEVYFHDPLAAALLFEPILCETRARRIAVDLLNESTPGCTRPVDGESAPHHVAYTVDVEAFFDHYFSVVGS